MEEFTREILESSLKSDLFKLATYYGIEINSRMLKEELIEVILEAQKPVEVEVTEQELPPMSVRVRRIYEGVK
jgi:hypothetical protein